MEQKEFTIVLERDEKKQPIRTLKWRPKEIPATEFLGLDAIINRENIEKATYMYAQIMERIEVEIAGTWQPLKQKDVEAYCPADLANRPGILYRICTDFLTKVFFPVFLESKESNN